MTPDQYIMRAVKKTGELYVISGSTLHETCRALEERRQVELKAEERNKQVKILTTEEAFTNLRVRLNRSHYLLTEIEAGTFNIEDVTDLDMDLIQRGLTLLVKQLNEPYSAIRNLLTDLK